MSHNIIVACFMFVFYIAKMPDSMNINEDIAKERRSATFNTDDITQQLYTDVNARRLACKYVYVCNTFL